MENIYVAIMNSGDFKSVYTRFFTLPDNPIFKNMDPAYYYLNYIDLQGCLKDVFPLDQLLHPNTQIRLGIDMSQVILHECAWCKRYKLAGTWSSDLLALGYQDLSKKLISHTLCSDCITGLKRV